MTDEEKKAAETAAAAEAQKAEQIKADAEFETSLASLSDEEKKAKRDERAQAHSQPDYKAIALQEKEAREKAEKALADGRFKDSERKRKEREARLAAGESAEDIDREDREKPLTEAQLDERFARERELNDKKLNESRAQEYVKSITENAEEADAVLETFKNRSFPSHLSLEQQLEESYYIVNGRALVGKTKELSRALKGKLGVNINSATSHREPSEQDGDPSLDQTERGNMMKLGFTWNRDLKRYEKKLQNGGTMFRDLKTGKNVFVKK